MGTKKITLTELRKKFSTTHWVMSYNALWAMYDEKNDTVMYVESYGPDQGFFIEGWRAFHFPRTSSIVKKSYREGVQSIFLIKPGKATLNLIPSLAPIGISECTVSDDTVKLTFAGHGGGGVSAAYSRGLAKGVLDVEVISPGGGQQLGIGSVTLPKKKLLLIGVDDTDNAQEGATYATVHTISKKISTKPGIEYLIHGNVQLFPGNPDKTKNCFATVVGFAIDQDKKDVVVNYFRKQLAKYTVSKHTAMCVTENFVIKPSLFAYAKKAKSSYISDLDEVKAVAAKNNIAIYPITGEKGLIGAVAAIGLYDKPDYASSLLPEQRI